MRDYSLVVTALVAALVLLATLGGCKQEDSPPIDSQQEEEEEELVGEEEEEDEPDDTGSDTPPETGETEEDTDPPVEEPPTKTIDEIVREIYNSWQEISNETLSFVSGLIEYNNLPMESQALLGAYPSLENIIGVVESNLGVTRDFTSVQSYVFANLVSEIPEITQYPKAMRLGAIQVDSQNLADEYAMDNFVIPAIRYIVELQDEGRIDALNGLGIPDAALEEEGIRQILLPIELREINIVTGYRHMRANIETGIYNVTFNEDLGKSPQEWLGEISFRDYNDKSLIVWEWIKEWPTEYGPRDIWVNSFQA